METFKEQQEEVRHDITRQHRRKIPALTGIRGVAAIWVVLLHADLFGKSYGIPLFQKPLPIIRSGHLGVDLFFMLSGFVLMLTYGKAVSSNWSGVRDFAVGRIFRILPLHWIVLLLFAAVTPWIGHDWINKEPHDSRYFFLSASLLQIVLGHGGAWNTPAWSLSAEWVCYFLFPLAAFIILSVRSSTVLIITMVVSALILVVAFSLRPPFVTLGVTTRAGLLRCATEMVIGIALCRLCVLSPPGQDAGNRMAVAGLALLSVAMIGSYAEFACLPGFALLIAACYSPSPLALALFGNRVVHWLGEISFSIYILHWLLFEVTVHLARASGSSSTAFLMAMLVPPVLVIPLAWLLWRQVEVRGQAAGRVVIARLRARDAARASLVTSSAR